MRHNACAKMLVAPYLVLRRRVAAVSLPVLHRELSNIHQCIAAPGRAAPRLQQVPPRVSRA